MTRRVVDDDADDLGALADRHHRSARPARRQLHGSSGLVGEPAPRLRIADHERRVSEDGGEAIPQRPARPRPELDHESRRRATCPCTPADIERHRDEQARDEQLVEDQEPRSVDDHLRARGGR